MGLRICNPLRPVSSDGSVAPPALFVLMQA
jgi:hypothetical protein